MAKDDVQDLDTNGNSVLKLTLTEQDGCNKWIQLQ